MKRLEQACERNTPKPRGPGNHWLKACLGKHHKETQSPVSNSTVAKEMPFAVQVPLRRVFPRRKDHWKWPQFYGTTKGFYLFLHQKLCFIIWCPSCDYNLLLTEMPLLSQGDLIEQNPANYCITAYKFDMQLLFNKHSWPLLQEMVFCLWRWWNRISDFPIQISILFSVVSISYSRLCPYL